MHPACLCLYFYRLHLPVEFFGNQWKCKGTFCRSLRACSTKTVSHLIYIHNPVQGLQGATILVSHAPKNLSSATKHFHFHWSHQCTWGLEISIFLNNKLRLSTCISNFSFLLHPVLTDNVKMYYWWHLDDMLVHLKETNECGAVRLLLCSVRSIRHIPTSDCNRVSLTSFS